MTPKFAFCTITYGKKYVDLGDNLISQINDRGYHIFVLTNDINHYTLSDKLSIVKYEKPYFSFHEKRTIVRECLKHYDIAIFLDADVHINEGCDLEIFNDIEPGLHIFSNFGDISGTFLNSDINHCILPDGRNTKYGEKGIKLLEELSFNYHKIYDNVTSGYLEHFLEGRWIIRKDGNEDEFFRNWDLMVPFCEEEDIRLGYVNAIGAGEGGVMSIAVNNSKLKLHNVSPLVSFIIANFISNYVEKVNNIKPWNIAG